MVSGWTGRNDQKERFFRNNTRQRSSSALIDRDGTTRVPNENEGGFGRDAESVGRAK